MSLTENGLGVADGVRGIVNEHLTPEPGADNPDAGPAMIEDGFTPRHSGRADLYPHAPMHFRSGPQRPATGRLDEVTAPESAEPKPEPPAMAFPPPRQAQAAPAAVAPVVAAPPSAPAQPVPAAPAAAAPVTKP